MAEVGEVAVEGAESNLQTEEENVESSNTEQDDGPGGASAPGAKPRRFLTRASASNRMKAQATLITSIRAMELDLDPENFTVNEVLTGQLLDILEREHNEYVGNLDPEKSYIKEFTDKLERARTKHNTRLGILPMSTSQNNPQPPGLDMVRYRIGKEKVR